MSRFYSFFGSSQSPKDKNEPWMSVAAIIKQKRSSIGSLLTDENLRIRVQFFCVYVAFVIIAFIMTIMNIITGWHTLTLQTAFFGVANIINIFLSVLSRQMEFFTRVLFAAEVILLITSFAIIGEPEGFSVIWAALLPAGGILLFRTRHGSIIAAVMFLILAFLFWTPFGKSLLMYDYSETFLLRFPVLFIAFYAVGLLLEFVRFITQRELAESRSKFIYMSNHDALTGLYSRYSFDTGLKDLCYKPDGYALVIFDIDFFKSINDTYGHLVGDEILKEVALRTQKIVKDDGKVIRWGGDEFAVLFDDAKKSEQICENLLKEMRDNEIKLKEDSKILTISMGLVKVCPGACERTTEIINLADENLYFSKENGKNRLTSSTLQ